MITSSTFIFFKELIICSIKGAPAIGIKCLGRVIVKGSSLTPFPAAKITAFVFNPPLILV